MKSILGVTPVQPGDTVRPKDAQQVLAGHVLQELRHIVQTSTERNARLASQVVNGVLEAGTVILDSAGRIERNYHVTVGSLVLINNTGATVTVAAGSAGAASAPTAGDGVHIIPTGLVMTIPLASRALTIFGTAGQPVTFQAWTGLQPFGIIQ